MQIIDIRRNSDKNILNESINYVTQNRIIFHQKILCRDEFPLSWIYRRAPVLGGGGWL